MTWGDDAGSQAVRVASRRGERRELFAPFWREGELAVLTGASGVGKSLLAVQIAEKVARATRPGHGRERTAADLTEYRLVINAGAVFYVDLERTAAQYRERYTSNNRRYTFSKQLDWGLMGDVEIPARYGRRPERFLLDAIYQKLADLAPSVVIVDNLASLVRSGPGSSGDLRACLRIFRRWVNLTGNSVLLLHHNETSASRPRRRRASSSLTVPAPLLTFCDSVFTLEPSTFSPEHRYMRQLKGGSIPDHNGQQAEDNSGKSALEPSHSTLVDPVHVYQLQTRLSTRGPAPHAPDSELSSPFPGFTFVGMSDEKAHTHDYAADVRKVEQAIERAAAKEQRRRKLSAKDALAYGLLDGSYARYLLGE